MVVGHVLLYLYLIYTLYEPDQALDVLNRLQHQLFATVFYSLFGSILKSIPIHHLNSTGYKLVIIHRLESFLNI